MFFQHTSIRSSAVWSSFHRIIFHIHGDLGEPVLLPLRFLILSIHHISNILLSTINSDGIFPTMFWGKQESKTSTFILNFNTCKVLTKTFFYFSLMLFVFPGLPLVVEELHSVGRLSVLHLNILTLLFPNVFRNNRIHSDFIVHRLHGAHGFNILAADGNDRLLCGLRIHPQNLQCGENRLNDAIQRLPHHSMYKP